MPPSLIPPLQPHHLEAERISLEIARRQTVAQKLTAIHTLQRMALGLKASVIRSKHPDYTDAEVKRALRDWVLHGAS